MSGIHHAQILVYFGRNLVALYLRSMLNPFLET